MYICKDFPGGTRSKKPSCKFRIHKRRVTDLHTINKHKMRHNLTDALI